MSEWLVSLVGREQDLRFLASAVRDPWRITEEDGKFYLRSSRFERLGDAGEVKRLADEFVDWADLHTLVRLERCGSVSTDAVLGVRLDGSRHTTVCFSTGLVFAEAQAIGVAAGDGSVPSPPDLHADMAVLKDRPRLAQALRYVRAKPDWDGYWKATEALGEDIGGLDKIVSHHGWATKDQYDRFYKTVHHHRHHRVPAPPNPVSEREAKSFLIGLLRSCIEWRLSRGRKG